VPHRPAIRHAGFTLVEMLAVIAVIAVAAAIATPQASSISPARVNATAGEIASALRFAQREAVRTGVWHRVEIDTAAQSVRVYRLAVSLTVKEDTSNTVLHPVDKREYRITFANGSAASANIVSGIFKYGIGTKNYVSFGPDGSPANLIALGLKYIDPLQEDGTITIRHGNVERVVKVAPVTGRVTF
jgi:prepilin-type N-terminal cleavage/methylation domain-containing protein